MNNINKCFAKRIKAITIIDNNNNDDKEDNENDNDNINGNDSNY